MASIQEYLDLIKNAIYGKDVRQAIHDGILQCYLDASGQHYAVLDRNKVNQPLDNNNQPINGVSGQVLRTKGNGSTEWADVGLPTDAQTASAVAAWLDDHPEATTTVQDGSVTLDKFASDVNDLFDDKPSYNVFNNYVLNPVKVVDIPSLEGYYPQGFAYDGTYFYCGFLDTATYNNGIIIKFNSAGTEIARSTDKFGHVNSIEIVNDSLYVATTGNIFVADKNTLAKTGEITCRGGSAWCANIAYSGSYGGVSGAQNLLYVGLSTTKGLVVYYGTDVIDNIFIPSTPLTQQGATGYNGYIYVAESVGADIGLFGIVTVYDTQGNVCARINTNLSGELEDICIRNNMLYMFGSFGGHPAIYSANISNLTPYLSAINPWYVCKGQRYKGTLTYSNSTQLTKIVVPPIVDVFLAYAQPIEFIIGSNAYFSNAHYISNGGFDINLYSSNGNPRPVFIRLHYKRTGTATYELDGCYVVSLVDGSESNAWNSNYPKVNNLDFVIGALIR